MGNWRGQAQDVRFTRRAGPVNSLAYINRYPVVATFMVRDIACDRLRVIFPSRLWLTRLETAPTS